jgi:hypothetical protein
VHRFEHRIVWRGCIICTTASPTRWIPPRREKRSHELSHRTDGLIGWYGFRRRFGLDVSQGCGDRKIPEHVASRTCQRSCLHRICVHRCTAVRHRRSTGFNPSEEQRDSMSRQMSRLTKDHSETRMACIHGSQTDLHRGSCTREQTPNLDTCPDVRMNLRNPEHFQV